jgi:hypothetical protein
MRCGADARAQETNGISTRSSSASAADCITSGAPSTTTDMCSTGIVRLLATVKAAARAGIVLAEPISAAQIAGSPPRSHPSRRRTAEARWDGSPTPTAWVCIDRERWRPAAPVRHRRRGRITAHRCAWEPHRIWSRRDRLDGSGPRRGSPAGCTGSFPGLARTTWPRSDAPWVEDLGQGRTALLHLRLSTENRHHRTAREGAVRPGPWRVLGGGYVRQCGVAAETVEGRRPVGGKVSGDACSGPSAGISMPLERRAYVTTSSELSI